MTAALPQLARQSPLYDAVKRACQSLKALLEAGVGVHHTERLLKLYQRLNAAITSPETPKPPEGDSSAATTTAAKMRSMSTGSNRLVSLVGYPALRRLNWVDFASAEPRCRARAVRRLVPRVRHRPALQRR